ncbi:MAG: DUF5683 domain-containing protein [Candidatus Neomarinimicrobiota bacterium]
MRLILRRSLILTGLLSFLPAQDAQNLVAVINFPALGISQLEVDSLTNRFRDTVEGSGDVPLMEKERMMEILNKESIQPKGCSSVWCAVELGEQLGVARVVIGFIQKEENRYALRAQLVSVGTGNLENSRESEYVGAEKSLGTEIEVLAYELFDLAIPPVLLEKHQRIVELSMELQGITAIRKKIGATLRSLIIPGLGQIYLDKKLWGFGWILTELALGGFIYSSYSSYQEAYDRTIDFLELYGSETDVDMIAEYRSEIQQSYHEAEMAVEQRKILTRVATILWAGNVLHAYLSAPKHESAHNNPSIKFAYDPQSRQTQLMLTIALD